MGLFGLLFIWAGKTSGCNGGILEELKRVLRRHFCEKFQSTTATVRVRSQQDSNDKALRLIQMGIHFEQLGSGEIR